MQATPIALRPDRRERTKRQTRDALIRAGYGHGSSRRALLATVAVVSAGGACGAIARYGLAVAMPQHPGRFPWATFTTNVSGCLLIGVLMALITELRATHPLLRQFLGVGVLGGFTTFSTYAVEFQQLVADGAAGTALGYLLSTLVAALAAVYTGFTATRAVIRRRR